MDIEGKHGMGPAVEECKTVVCERHADMETNRNATRQNAVSSIHNSKCHGNQGGEKAFYLANPYFEENFLKELEF